MSTFLRAVRTGKTDSMEALDVIFANPGALSEHPNLDDFQEAGALDTLPDWARAELRRVGLRTAEINHIDDWPNDQKEEVRQALVQAIAEDQSVDFLWALHDGENEETEVTGGQDTDVAVIFRTPERRVRAIGTDNVVVDVGA
jgi:hypothetical protein